MTDEEYASYQSTQGGPLNTQHRHRDLHRKGKKRHAYSMDTQKGTTGVLKREDHVLRLSLLPIKCHIRAVLGATMTPVLPAINRLPVKFSVKFRVMALT